MQMSLTQSSSDSLADHTNGDVGTACKKCSWTHGPHASRMIGSMLAHCRWGWTLPDRPRRTPTNRRRVHSASPIKNGGSAIARTPQMLVVQLQRKAAAQSRTSGAHAAHMGTGWARGHYSYAHPMMVRQPNPSRRTTQPSSAQNTGLTYNSEMHSASGRMDSVT